MRNGYFRSRGYLPHLEISGSTYLVTLRLADTLPQNVLLTIREEVQMLRAIGKERTLTLAEQERLSQLQTEAIQTYLDRGHGECFLANSAIARMVNEAIEHHDRQTYFSMPHVLCQTICTGL